MPKGTDTSTKHCTLRHLPQHRKLIFGTPLPQHLGQNMPALLRARPRPVLKAVITNSSTAHLSESKAYALRSIHIPKVICSFCRPTPIVQLNSRQLAENKAPEIHDLLPSQRNWAILCPSNSPKIPNFFSGNGIEATPSPGDLGHVEILFCY